MDPIDSSLDLSRIPADAEETALRKQLALARSQLARLRLERDLNELGTWSTQGQLVARGALIVWGASRLFRLKSRGMLATGALWQLMQKVVLHFGSWRTGAEGPATGSVSGQTGARQQAGNQ